MGLNFGLRLGTAIGLLKAPQTLVQPGLAAGKGFSRWQDMAFLTSISLQNSSSIDDSGLEALARLLHLRSLNLKGCREITNEGLRALKPLQRLTNLRIQVRHFGRSSFFLTPRSCVQLTVWEQANSLQVQEERPLEKVAV